jgi:tetratricopeptide (TPR) repeat protein
MVKLRRPIRIDHATPKEQTPSMISRLRFAILAVHALALALVSAEPPSKARFALVVGNAKYNASIGTLRNSVNDAKAVSKTLRGLGFTVIEEHNVSRDDLLKAVSGFREKIKDAEVALFYYAGHGISVAGSNYLIPIKSGYQSDGADDLTLRMLAETKFFNAEQVVAEMSAAGARCNLVILDACRNTPLARDTRTRDATSRGGLAEMKPPAGSLIAFATDAGHTAQDGEGANGLYTGELLKHLQTPGLTIEQVFKRTRAGVMEQSDGAQIPAEYSRLVGEDIYLAGHSAAAPAKPALPKAEPVRIPTSGEITRLAAAGKSEECIDALRLATAANGAGNFAAAPIDSLLENAKENLKEATGPSPKVEAAMKTCQLSLDAIRDFLPADHPRRAELTSMARNRLGDCLFLSGKTEDAIQSYNVAIELAPIDAYPIYNRGRAYLFLGKSDEAKADFTTAADPKFKQAGARKLALKALTEFE